MTKTVSTQAAPGSSSEPDPLARAPWWARLDLGRVDLWVGLLVVAACCTFVVVQLEPRLLLRNTTPSGGDTAAHVWWPAYLRDHLLPWRLAGWSPDFYAGFSAGQFYFPVPALLIVALDTVIPYNIAFKLVTALGAVLLPAAAYVFGRGVQAPKPAPAAFAVAATAFLFFPGDPGTSDAAKSIAFNQRIAGGTLASLLAGEFSYTLALAFALGFLGMLAYSLRTGRLLWLPPVLLAACAMSHLVVVFFAGLGALVVWLAFRPMRNLGRVVAIGAVAVLLTTVWSLPLLATLGYTTDMRYTPITQYVDYLFPSYLWGVEGAWPWEWGATVLIGAALIGALVRRRRVTATLTLVTLAALCGLLFRLWEDLQATPAWNLRFVPFWYLALFLLMGLGLAEMVRGAAWLARVSAYGERRMPSGLVRAGTIAVLTVVLALGALVGVDREKSFLPYWIRWNYRGYEDTTGDGATPRKQYDEYRALVDTLDALSPGRVVWEGNTQLNVYGSPLALMLLPYWTAGRIASMEGVYYEASATTPYHFMATAALAAPGNSSNAVRGVPYRSQTDFALGVRWLQILGARYLAVHSAQARQAADADPRLTLVATSPDLDHVPPEEWSIFRVAGSALVEVLDYQPVVVDHLTSADLRACRKRLRARGLGSDLRVHEWQDCIAVPWFDDPAGLGRPLVAEGPSSWQHAGAERARTAREISTRDARVSGIQADDDSISFRVSRPGVPVLIKTSYFPNWEAHGARGPYRATPNFMVVVPTRHDVRLTYATTSAEWLGRIGTLAGLAGLVGLVWWSRRYRAAGEIQRGSPDRDA